MNYIVNLGDKEVVVGVEDSGIAQFKVVVGEDEVKVDAHRVEPNTWSIIVDNRTYEADLVVSEEAIEVHIRGDMYPLKVINEQRKALRRAGEIAEGGKQLLTAPMPGKVIKILVDEGEEVGAQQGLIIIEAMKMENEFKSSAPGKVKEVFISEGDVVDSGDKLLLIE